MPQTHILLAIGRLILSEKALHFIDDPNPNPNTSFFHISDFEIPRVILSSFENWYIFILLPVRGVAPLRSGFRVAKLSQAGVPMARRFTFYDQVRRNDG